MKKTLILILLLFVLFGCQPDSNKYTKGIVFEFNEETQSYSVVGYEGEDTTLIIPSKYEGYPVTHMDLSDYNELYDIRVEKVVLPESLLSIGGGTFSLELFENLEEVIIPKNCKDFVRGFMYHNHSMDIVIPEDHNYYKEVVIDDVEIVMTKNEKEIVYINNTTDENKVLTIPNGVEKIGEYAATYTKYKEIKLPEGLKEIGRTAFAGTRDQRTNKKATIINLPSTLEHIGLSAFAVGFDGGELVLPPNLKTIDAHAFAYNNLHTIRINNGLTQFAFLFGELYIEDNYNHVTTVVIEDLNLSGETLDNFLKDFVSTNFQHGYKDEVVTIVLPNNDSKDKIKLVVEMSLEIAKLKNPYVNYPTFVFEYSE
ncbi:MAG TPA: leucine-rich repeat protein [Acholeplasmataceae bacterium]|nr:leucine-rich repeat protein [Acholeplasmataceae bacterium]